MAPACLQVSCRLGSVIEAEEGIPQKTLLRRLLKLAVVWCIPPAESAQFRLYRDPSKALDYIYKTETLAYHAWRSNTLGWTAKSRQLIQDKALFAEVLAKEAIPVVTTLATGSGIEPFSTVETYLHQYKRLFCKTNTGNQGKGAFTIWETDDGMVGRTFTGRSLENRKLIVDAWSTLTNLGQFLIQPCLENHFLLAPLAFNDDVITVRLISQWLNVNGEVGGERLNCLSATLEVPAGLSKRGDIYYAILPINLATGELATPMRPLAKKEEMLQALNRIENDRQTISQLPFWPLLIEYSFSAHRIVPDICAIAWDWVITPTGPVLLEGNSGWGCVTPQLLNGGFLANSY